MDPITLAITNALGNLGVKVINDAYNAVKAVLQKKYGVKSDLVKAVKKLEEKPSSEGRQAVLQEEIETAKADKDLEVLKAAQALLDKLGDQPNGSTVITQQAGDNVVQIGQVSGDANIKR